MEEKVGLELIKQIVKNRTKVGKNPWEQFIAIDYGFIEKHFGTQAAIWAQEQRDIDMTKMIEVFQKNPIIKEAVEVVEKKLILKK